MSDLLLELIRRVVLECEERHGYMPATEQEARDFKPHQWVRDVCDQWATRAYAEGRKDEAEACGWQPIGNAPEDELILVATTGGHVDTAHWTDDGDGVKWWWSPGRIQQLHAALVPMRWMPLPKHPESS